MECRRLVFDPTKIGSSFTYVDSTTSYVGAADKVVAKANPYRVAIIFQGFASGAFLRPIYPAATNLGINLVASGAPVELDMHSTGPLCQLEWHAFGAAGSIVYVLETLWLPPGG